MTQNARIFLAWLVVGEEVVAEVDEDILLGVVHSHLEEDIVEVIEVAVEDIRRIESRS